MLTATKILSLQNKSNRYGFTNVFDFGANGTIYDVFRVREAIDFIQNHCIGDTLKFPNTQYIFTEDLVIGGQPISVSDALKYSCEPGNADSFNITEWIKGGRTLPINLSFANRAYILANFKTDEPKAVISYGCSAYQFGLEGMQNSVIEGLKIIGPKGFENVPVEQNNITGLLMLGGNSIVMKDCHFMGLDEGFVHNSSYHSRLEGMNFYNCGRGFLTIGSHAPTATPKEGKKICFKADHCNVGFEILSGVGSWQGMHTEQCRKGLIVGGSVNSFNGLYLEQLDKTSGENEYQLQIGYEDGEPVMNTTITGLNIAGDKGILMNPTAKGVTVTGSGLISSGIKTTHAENVIDFTNSSVDVVWNQQHANHIGKVLFK